MELTTLCYIERDDAYLMLHRIKKEKDVNRNKWIGVGGHFEEGESPEECLLREVKEETGLTLTHWRFRGIVTFCFRKPEPVPQGQDRQIEPDPPICEYMCLYTADGFEGELIECKEGNLEWVSKQKLEELELWEGDKIFFRLLERNTPFFSLKLSYMGDNLEEAVLDGTQLLQKD